MMADKFRIYGQRIPARFGLSTLTKCLCTTKWDVEHLVADWLRRRWVRRIRAGYFRKTRNFGMNDLAHLQPEIFPRVRWSRRDIINARLDELIVQHSQRRNKDRRAFWADQIEDALNALF